MLRRLLDSPWTYFSLAGVLLVVLLYTQFEIQLPPRDRAIRRRNPLLTTNSTGHRVMPPHYEEAARFLLFMHRAGLDCGTCHTWMTLLRRFAALLGRLDTDAKGLSHFGAATSANAESSGAIGNRDAAPERKRRR